MLQNYKEKWDRLEEKKNLKGKVALEAVKQDGFALKYVNEQMFKQTTAEDN
jgi:hypothetical protein